MAGLATNKRVTRAFVVVMLLGATACGTDATQQSTTQDSAADAVQSDDASESISSVAAAAEDVSDAATVVELADAYRSVAEASVELELMMTAESAVDLVFHPVDGTLHVVEHGGRVVRVNDDDETNVVADLTERLVGHRDEQGLNGLEFSADGQVAWLHYTLPNGTTTVSEVAVGDDGAFDLGSERELFALE